MSVFMAPPDSRPRSTSGGIANAINAFYESVAEGKRRKLMEEEQKRQMMMLQMQQQEQEMRQQEQKRIMQQQAMQEAATQRYAASFASARGVQPAQIDYASARSEQFPDFVGPLSPDMMAQAQGRENQFAGDERNRIMRGAEGDLFSSFLPAALQGKVPMQTLMDIMGGGQQAASGQPMGGLLPSTRESIGLKEQDSRLRAESTAKLNEIKGGTEVARQGYLGARTDKTVAETKLMPVRGLALEAEIQYKNMLTTVGPQKALAYAITQVGHLGERYGDAKEETNQTLAKLGRVNQSELTPEESAAHRKRVDGLISRLGEIADEEEVLGDFKRTLTSAPAPVGASATTGGPTGAETDAEWAARSRTIPGMTKEKARKLWQDELARRQKKTGG